VSVEGAPYKSVTGNTAEESSAERIEFFEGVKYHPKSNNWTFCVQRFKQLDSFGPLKGLIEKGKKGGHPVFSLKVVFSFLNFGKFVKLFQKTS
jgi:hypothetical protein